MLWGWSAARNARCLWMLIGRVRNALVRVLCMGEVRMLNATAITNESGDGDSNTFSLLVVDWSLCYKHERIGSALVYSIISSCYIFFSAPCMRTKLLVLFAPSNRTTPMVLCPAPPIFSRTPSPYSSWNTRSPTLKETSFDTD